MRSINYTIAIAIAESIYGREGEFNVELDVDDVMIVVNGSFEIDGYMEDDYFDGTGAWITTDVFMKINTITSCNEDGDKVDLGLSVKEIERHATSLLVA